MIRIPLIKPPTTLEKAIMLSYRSHRQAETDKLTDQFLKQFKPMPISPLDRATASINQAKAKSKNPVVDGHLAEAKKAIREYKPLNIHALQPALDKLKAELKADITALEDSHKCLSHQVKKVDDYAIRHVQRILSRMRILSIFHHRVYLWLAVGVAIILALIL